MDIADLSFSGSLHQLNSFLMFEIIHLEGQSVTVKSILIAFVFLGLGIYFSKKISRLFIERVVRRFQTDPGIVLTIQTISFYILITFIVLLSLTIAGIPLTIFTFAGGALAIGLGFGSQNILKNFISGIILMFDRPMRIGDFIEINETYGQVERIGFRATRLLTYGNIHVIFPNSTFLEQNFINWTLLNREIRISVRVGVAYGSDTNKVRELLTQAAAQHPRSLAANPPAVLFQDFGDNALIFDVFFSIKMMDLRDRRTVESEIRFEIDRLFREAEICIAFPQRDVHLDSLKPIELVLKDSRA